MWSIYQRRNLTEQVHPLAGSLLNRHGSEYLAKQELIEAVTYSCLAKTWTLQYKSSGPSGVIDLDTVAELDL